MQILSETSQLDSKQLVTKRACKKLSDKLSDFDGIQIDMATFN